MAASTDRRAGIRKGEPLRFVHGHNSRLQASQFELRYERGLPDDCWEWQGTRNAGGYGRFGNHLAHRVAYERAHGVALGDRQLDHLCRNRACVNPRHLEIVTNQVNVQRGVKAHLTPEQALAIHAAPGTVADVAARFGVPERTVAAIVSGETWSNVTGGRARVGPHRRTRGTKLTREDAELVRVWGGTQKQIAERFGIAQSTVSQIRNRQRWA